MKATIRGPHTPQEGEQITPDHLNLFILFACGQALIVVVDHEHLSLALCIIHLPLEACQGDGLVPLVLLGPRGDPSRREHCLTRSRCPWLTEVGACTLALQLFVPWGIT